MTTSFFYFLAYIALLTAGGFVVTRKWDDAPTTALAKKCDDVNRLTRSYNDVINSLVDSYNMEDELNWSSLVSSRYTKKQYSKKYEAVRREYQAKRSKIISQWAQTHPQWAKSRTVWGWIFVIGMISALACCTFSMPIEEEVSPATASSAMDSAETTYWNADNIPIPYLQDATQYVSNPDNVLSQATVDSMNIVLKRLETSLGVQSVVIVVNHIENDDPFRMAQDVGNKYGVGHNDRGLVIVCGYADHSINMSPGRELEADLTDAECSRLQREYVVPAMRAEMPDSAMLYLTKAIYAVLEKKEMPAMTTLMSDQDDADDAFVALMCLYTLFFVGWAIFFARLNRKYHWVGLVGAVPLLSNPFYMEEASSASGGGFFGGGGGGGFSGGGGGSFGGGSFGGGGATSRW